MEIETPAASNILDEQHELISPVEQVHLTVRNSDDPSSNILDKQHELISPEEQVRRTVPSSDDPSLPVWTFRMWFLGLLSCILLSSLNQFFSYPKQLLIITQITVQIAISWNLCFREPSFGCKDLGPNGSRSTQVRLT